MTKRYKRLYEKELHFIKLVNSPKNLSSIGLTYKQVKALSNYVVKAIRTGESGSYRTLIYDVLGGVAYCDGYVNMGLGDLNNALSQGCDRKCKRRKYLF